MQKLERSGRLKTRKEQSTQKLGSNKNELRKYLQANKLEQLGLKRISQETLFLAHKLAQLGFVEAYHEVF